MTFTLGQVEAILTLFVVFLGGCVGVMTLFDNKRSKWIDQANERMDRQDRELAEKDAQITTLEKRLKDVSRERDAMARELWDVQHKDGRRHP